MPLDDLDLPNSIKSNPTQKRFYRSGIILISIGILSSLILFLSFSDGYEPVYKNPFVYLPIIIGLIPFFFSTIYAYFENSIKEPLKDGWGKIHFYSTIPLLYFIQIVGIIYFHHLYMSGINPFVANSSFFSILCLSLFIGQLLFLANIFRSLKLTFYKNVNYHPTHILFLFAAFFFLLKFATVYFFGSRNSMVDFQLHDTYFVVSSVHIHLFIVFIFILFAGLYYFLNRNLKKPLNSFLSKSHFFLMLLSILYFVYAYLGYDFSVRRYYSSPEAASQLYSFMRNQLMVVGGSFLFAQVLFLINFIRSILISFSEKNK
jgi:heme/copper-type cytochrome/quinol oxidase subunit 1